MAAARGTLRNSSLSNLTCRNLARLTNDLAGLFLVETAKQGDSCHNQAYLVDQILSKAVFYGQIQIATSLSDNA